MSRPAKVWLILTLLYALFFSWYTSFGGPLSAAEIDRYSAVLSQGGDPERLAIWRAFMESDTGDDFAMINVMQLRDTPEQVSGVEAGESSNDVMSRYVVPFMRQAMKDAAHPVLYGLAANQAMDLWGIEGAEHWTSGGLVRYRSRRDLLEQVMRLRGSGIHAFKTAALEKTIAYPLDPWFSLGDPRFVLALIFASLGLGVHLRVATRRARSEIIAGQA